MGGCSGRIRGWFLPEGLLLVVHTRHGVFRGRVFVQFCVDYRLGQLKIFLVHLPFSLFTDDRRDIKEHDVFCDARSTMLANRTERCLVAYWKSSLSPTALTLSTSMLAALTYVAAITLLSFFVASPYRYFPEPHEYCRANSFSPSFLFHK